MNNEWTLLLILALLAVLFETVESDDFKKHFQSENLDIWIIWIFNII